MRNATEHLLAKIMLLLGRTLQDRLVLKGGMLLRLLQSPRTTQDIDYVLRSTASKKIESAAIRKALEQMPTLVIRQERLNSRGIFLTVCDTATDTMAAIEINVHPGTALPPGATASTPLTQAYRMPNQIITTMALPEALAHKIAATLERDVVRDLYDISILEPLTSFDRPTLTARLARLCIDRAKPIAVDIPTAATMLRDKIAALTEERLQVELSPLLPPDHLPGLIHIIGNTTRRVIQSMEYGG